MKTKKLAPRNVAPVKRESLAATSVPANSSIAIEIVASSPWEETIGGGRNSLVLVAARSNGDRLREDLVSGLDDERLQHCHTSGTRSLSRKLQCKDTTVISFMIRVKPRFQTFEEYLQYKESNTKMGAFPNIGSSILKLKQFSFWS